MIVICSLGVQGILSETQSLSGSHKPRARFGTAITAAGDLNDDGYQGKPQTFGLGLGLCQIHLSFVCTVDMGHRNMNGSIMNIKLCIKCHIEICFVADA